MGVGAELKVNATEDELSRSFDILLHVLLCISLLLTIVWGAVLIIGTAELFIAIISKFVSVSTP